MKKYSRYSIVAVRSLWAAALFLISTAGARAADVAGPSLDTGNTAWMIVATVLVLLMSIPGIALFYGGLVRQKNVLSVVMQTMLIVGVVSILWVAFGYSWVFGTGFRDSGNPLWGIMGGTDKLFLCGISPSSLTTGNIPELTCLHSSLRL